MREIRFRGKRKDNDEWIFGSLITFEGCTEICDHSCIVGTRYEVDADTVGEFTGLMDKNGKDIYEGDICKEVYVPLGSNPKIIEYYKIGVIVWSYNKYGLMLKIDGTNVLDHSKKSYYHQDSKEIYKHSTAGLDWINGYIDFERLKILGNIHDNPQLLKTSS